MHEKHTFEEVREPIWSRGSGVQRFDDAWGQLLDCMPPRLKYEA